MKLPYPYNKNFCKRGWHLYTEAAPNIYFTHRDEQIPP